MTTKTESTFLSHLGKKKKENAALQYSKVMIIKQLTPGFPKHTK